MVDTKWTPRSSLELLCKKTRKRWSGVPAGQHRGVTCWHCALCATHHHKFKLTQKRRSATNNVYNLERQWGPGAPYTLQSKNKINHFIPQTENNSYCQIMPLLLFKVTACHMLNVKPSLFSFMSRRFTWIKMNDMTAPIKCCQNISTLLLFRDTCQSKQSCVFKCSFF